MLWVLLMVNDVIMLICIYEVISLLIIVILRMVVEWVIICEFFCILLIVFMLIE